MTVAINSELANIPSIALTEQVGDVATPSGGYAHLYVKAGLLYVRNAAGIFTPLYNPMTTQDDMIVGGVSGEPARLAKGTGGYVLRCNPSTQHLEWATPSAGAQITSSAYASPPSTPASGDLWLPSDSPYALRYSGAAWVPWGPLQPLTLPPTADWTWVNQGGASVDTSKGNLYLLDPANATEAWRLYTRAVPTRPYTITTLVYPFVTPGNYPGCGIGWRDSSGGKWILFGPQYKAGGGRCLSVFKRQTTGGTGDGGEYVTVVNAMFDFLPIWLQISEEAGSGNRICRWSTDGAHFTTLHTVSRTDYITADTLVVGAAAINATYPCGINVLSWAS